MNFKEAFQSNRTKKLLWLLGVLVLLLLSFGAGMVLGYNRAIFADRWGENYVRNFYGGRGGALVLINGRANMMDSHGVVGAIIDISSSTLAVKDRANNEGSVLVSDDTIIKRGQATINLADLTVGDNVAVIGNPNGQGQIEARFIRVFPASSSVMVDFPPPGVPLPPSP